MQTYEVYGWQRERERETERQRERERERERETADDYGYSNKIIFNHILLTHAKLINSFI